jgi:spore coat polysaccharide biosynthesis protein SpsF
MGSTRLPGKVLMDIGGETVLSRVLKRLSRARQISEIVVATTVSSTDDLLVQDAKQIGVRFFRGPENDVLSRYCQAATAFNADGIVRITADCPLIDSGLVDDVIEAFAKNGPDLACNDFPRTFPRGLDTEVFTIHALRRAEELSILSHQREHVTPVFYERQDVFRIHSVCAGQDYSRNRWTLDTAEDLELIRAIYSYFDNRDDFTWHEVLAMLENAPELVAINSHIVQKTVDKTAAAL